MKILLLIITLLLFIQRIINTPESLSEKKYKQKAYNTAYNLSLKVKQYSNTNYESFRSIIIGSIYTYNILLILYYLISAVQMSHKSQFFVTLSIMQIATILWSISRDLDENTFSRLLNGYIEYHRGWIIFNIILDYIYYPVFIYLVLFRT